MYKKVFICLLISLSIVSLTLSPKNTFPKKPGTPSEAEYLNTIETIIDSRDETKSGYLGGLVRNNPYPSVRSRAIGALMLLSDDGSIHLLSEKLTKDPSPLVRRAAAYAMCEMRSNFLIGSLVKAVEEDDDSVVRAISARAIGFQGIREPGSMLISHAMSDPSYLVRIESATALAKLKIREAIEPLKIVITKDPEKLVKIGAIKALSSFKDGGDMDLFMREFQTATDLDIRFELYIGIISFKNSATYLELGLKDGDERMRFLALKKITETMKHQRRGSPTSKEVMLLKNMLSDPFKGIRELANDTLNRLGYKTKDLGVRYEVVK